MADKNDRSQGKRIPCDFLNNLSSVDPFQEEKSWNKTPCKKIGNLRTTTKFTTTTSVDRESTGTRTSVSARKRKLKMQALGRTTTALNVNTKLFVRDKVFWQWRRLKQCKIFFF